MEKKSLLSKKDSRYWDSLSQMITETERLRLQMKMSQKDLAKKMGTTQSVISRFENMGRTPNYDFIVRLADALDCTVQIDFVKNNLETVEKIKTEVSQTIQNIGKDVPRSYGEKYENNSPIETEIETTDIYAA